MPVPLATLQALESGFSATRVGPEVVQPGQPVRVRLSPSTVDVQHVTDLLSGELSLTWITKSVRFKEHQDHMLEPAFAASPFDPAALDLDNVLEGGMPVRLPVEGNIVGTQQLTGVPGQLAQLAGTVPIPVSTEVPVQVGVSWTVHDENGVEVAPGATSFSAPQGTTHPEVSFVFPLKTVELTADIPVPAVRWSIRASVTLTAGGVSHPFALPDIPVVIPAVPIPTVVVFFRHSNFSAGTAGAAFIVVPDNSPLRNLAQLQDALNTVQTKLGVLTSVANLAAFLLGLQELSNALAAQPHVQFRVTRDNTFNNFNSVILIERNLNFDTQAEDELSSMIFIGIEDKRVECFNDRFTRRKEGVFILATGPEQHALVRYLHAVNLAVEPAGAGFALSVRPPGGLLNPDHFGDNLSSMKFL